MGYKKSRKKVQGGNRKWIAKRNQLVYVYCKYGLTYAEAAGVFNLTKERIRQIVKQKENEDDAGGCSDTGERARRER